MSRSLRRTALAHRAAEAHIAAAEARAISLTAVGTGVFCAIGALVLYAFAQGASMGWDLVLTAGYGVFGLMTLWSTWTAITHAYSRRRYEQEAHARLAHMREEIARDALPKALNERRVAITIARRTRELEARSDLAQSLWQILSLGLVLGVGVMVSIVLFVAVPPLGVVASLMVLLCACVFTVVLAQTVFQTVPALALVPLTSRMDRDDVMREERQMISGDEAAGALQLSVDPKGARGALTQAVGKGEVEVVEDVSEPNRA